MATNGHETMRIADQIREHRHRYDRDIQRLRADRDLAPEARARAQPLAGDREHLREACALSGLPAGREAAFAAACRTAARDTLRTQRQAFDRLAAAHERRGRLTAAQIADAVGPELGRVQRG